MRAHYVPEDLRRCEREGGLCGNSTGAVCISPLRHRRLFALPTLFLHPHRSPSPSPLPPTPLQHHHQLLPHPAQPLCLHHPLQRAPIPAVRDVRTLRRIPGCGSCSSGKHPLPPCPQPLLLLQVSPPSVPPRSLPLPPRSPALSSRPFTAPVRPPLEWAYHLAGNGSVDL